MAERQRKYLFEKLTFKDYYINHSLYMNLIEYENLSEILDAKKI